MRAASLARREKGHLLPSTIKLVLLVNAYLDERYHGVPLARVHNQRLALGKAFDDALDHFDVLLTPTGRDEQDLPTSVQVIGTRWGDRRVLAVGSAIEAAIT